jgi:hypothetical protein
MVMTRSRFVVRSWKQWNAMAALLAASLAVLGASAAAEVRATRQDADVMKQKLETILEQGERPSTESRRTMVSENELNSYLTFELAEALPAGMADPSVAILGTGRISGRATVNLDEIRKAGTSQGVLDPRSYLIGQLPVAAIGVLRAVGGVGRFQLESASLGGVPIPKVLLQEIVSYYTRSPENPDGVSLDDEFVLPSGIREIQVLRGHAVVIQ